MGYSLHFSGLIKSDAEVDAMLNELRRLAQAADLEVVHRKKGINIELGGNAETLAVDIDDEGRFTDSIKPSTTNPEGDIKLIVSLFERAVPQDSVFELEDDDGEVLLSRGDASTLHVDADASIATQNFTLLRPRGVGISTRRGNRVFVCASTRPRWSNSMLGLEADSPMSSGHAS